MKIFTTIILFVFCHFVYAQDNYNIVITLSAEEISPTAEQVVADRSLNPPPVAFILSSFNTHPPLIVDYYMKIRAYGELKNLIDNKPSWGRSLLERS